MAASFPQDRPQHIREHRRGQPGCIRIDQKEGRISGKQLGLSEETRPIVGGLILSQGKIEVNCALDTLAALRRSELSAEAAGLLFG